MDKSKLTEEELKFYNSLTTKEKISFSLKHRSDEEKEQAELKRKQTRENWSPQYKKSVYDKITSTKESYSEERKSQRLKKFRETLNNKTEEEKEEHRRKLSEATKTYFANMTEEERKAFSNKMSESYAKLSSEAKINRVIKGQQTKLEKYGKYNPMFSDEVKKKLIATNLEKYGVPYFCMTESCRCAVGGNTANSKPNQKFKELLTLHGLNYSQEFSIDTYSYDFKVGDILIEIDPAPTHNSTFGIFGNPLSFDYHTNKTLTAKKHGFRCIHIFDWDDSEKVINLIKNKESIYARKCLVKEIDYEHLNLFLNSYHFQGTCKNQNIRLGLFYGEELVQVMTFGAPRYNKNYEYELLRLCTKFGYKVVGGAEKLFKYFINNYSPKSIISYCDNSKFEGDVYTRLGFTLSSWGSPGKHWYNMKTGQHITDNLLRQRGFDQLFNTNFGKGTDNNSLMLENGFVEIYDCGQSSYSLKR